MINGPQGFCGSGEYGYLFSESWGALVISFSTKINTFTFYKRVVRGGGGAIAPQSQRNVKKRRLLLFTSYITHTRRVDRPVIMWF